MSRKIIILCLALNLPVQVFAQVEYPALQNIRKGKWDKAAAQLRKAMRKDTINIALSYGWATYFFSSNNPHFDLDSANHFARKGFRDLLNIPLKERSKPKRFSADSLVLLTLSRHIDSVAFIRTTAKNTTREYQHFIDDFPNAQQYVTATELRDEAAYQDALALNRHEGYKQFIKSYPMAARIPEAIQKYELLLYESITRDKRLTSYEKYVNEFPDGHYIAMAKRQRFEIVTADGSAESLQRYIQNSPTDSKWAQNILFHLTGSKRNSKDPGIWGDSLAALLKSPVEYLAPFFKGGRFGFMDQNGRTVIKPEEAEIDDDYLCGNIADDAIILKQKVVTLNGSVIYKGHVEDLEDIGSGFLLLEDGGCYKVLHKSGFRVGEDCLTNAKVINGCFLALQKEGKWALYTLTGRMIMPYRWEVITSIYKSIAFVNDGKYRLNTIQSLAELANGAQVDTTNADLEEISAWTNSRIWAKKGSREFVLNMALDTLLSGEHESLTAIPLGIVSKGSDGLVIVNNEGVSSSQFDKVEQRGPWTAVKFLDHWRLYDPVNHRPLTHPLDSIVFVEKFAIGTWKDSTEIFFPRASPVRLKGKVQHQLIVGTDSTSFLVVGHLNKRWLYTLDGKKLFQVLFERIEYAGKGYFTVYRNGKVGLVTSTGKVVIPPTLDAVGAIQKNSISTLKSAKFGSMNTINEKIIPPQYAKNITHYNADVMVVFKSGLYGLSGWDNKPISKFEFDEVRFWNDSAALVRKGAQWMIYGLKKGEILLDQIRSLEPIRDTPGEKLAIVQFDRSFGVINSRRGTILPFSYSDIVNIGSARVPLYFTEKHVEEASVYVVAYYDAKGRLLRKEVYDQDDYERIYCSNN